MTKLPLIQYFYGNTDLNNWIRNCKPFKPRINVERTYMCIQTIEVSEELKEHIRLQQEAFREIFNYKWL